MNETDSYINFLCNYRHEETRRGGKFVRGIIRSYLIRRFYFAAITAARRYSVVINNGDKGLPYYVVLNNTSRGQWVAIITVPFPPRIMRARLTRA